MAWTFNSVTTKQSGSGAVAVTYPVGISIGDTVFLHCNRGFGSGLTYTASDFTPLVSRNNQNSTALLYRVVDGTEGSTSSVTNSGGSSCTYFMSWFSGGPSAAAFPSSIITASTQGATGSGLNYNALSVASNPNCLIIMGGAKQASLTSYNIPAAFTGELMHSITSDGGQSFVWDYLIETTAVDLASGSWTVSGDASAVHQSVGAVILPGTPVVAPPTSGGIFVCP